jgi:uncharacterized protein YjfI (DUF2170 family)
MNHYQTSKNVNPSYITIFVSYTHLPIFISNNSNNLIIDFVTWCGYDLRNQQDYLQKDYESI